MFLYMQKNTYCSGDCNVGLQEFGRKCQRAVLHSLIRENINNGMSSAETSVMSPAIS